jgi:hypothetical protein
MATSRFRRRRLSQLGPFSRPLGSLPWPKRKHKSQRRSKKQLDDRLANASSGSRAYGICSPGVHACHTPFDIKLFLCRQPFLFEKRGSDRDGGNTRSLRLINISDQGIRSIRRILTSCLFTNWNGCSTIWTRVRFQASATFRNPAPGNHVGRRFTVEN